MKTALIISLFLLTCFVSSTVIATTYYVNGTTGNDDWNGLFEEPGTPPDGPKKTIQAGIDASTYGDTVIVAYGTYTGDGNRNLNFAGRAITLRSKNGPTSTVLDCEGVYGVNRRGFKFESGEGPDSVVDGFGITNAVAQVGGAIAFLYDDSSPTIMNCIITYNWARDAGGGIYSCYCSPTIINCVITDNWVLGNDGDDGMGGGIALYHSNASVIGCLISDNYATEDGGGIHCTMDSMDVIRNCVIRNNLTDGHGGGIYCYWGSSIMVENCVVTGNEADYAAIMCYLDSDLMISNCLVADNVGSGIGCIYSSPTITNCTVTSNASDGWYCGIGAGNESSPIVTNCIVWDGENSLPSGGDSTITVDYSCVQGGWSGPGTNNIDDVPLFVYGPLHDYYLSHIAAGQAADSPCVDAGSDTAANLGLDQLTTRVDSEYDTGTVDMGYHAPSTIWIYSITRSGNDITIEWKARTGFSYVVEWSTDADFGTYTEVPVGQTDTWTDVAVSETTKFYRVFEQ